MVKLIVALRKFVQKYIKEQINLQNLYQYQIYNRSADKSLARPGRKQALKQVRDARDFNNIETRAVIKFFFPLQGKAPKEIHAILTETLACSLPGRAKDLSATTLLCTYRVSISLEVPNYCLKKIMLLR